jgi:hypothetical protein
MIQGINDLGFYDLINGALNFAGYADIKTFFERAPKNWFDTENWRNSWNIEPYENPTRDFKQYIGEVEIPIMATYLADDAETPLISNQGFEVKTNNIPRMGIGYLFGVKAYEDARKANAQIGEINSRLFDAFRRDSFSLISGIQSQRSFTAAQVESLGYYKTTSLNNNGGISNVEVGFSVPAANKKNAGGYAVVGYSNGTKNAWSGSSAKPIGDLKDMFHYGWVNGIISANKAESNFRMSKTAYEVLKEHIDTRTRIATYKNGIKISDADYSGFEVTDRDLNDYMTGIGLPLISVDEYYGFTEYVDANQELKRKEVEAFDSSSVVLRPKGKVGSFQWSRVPNIFASATSPIYYADGGTIAIQEDIMSRQNGKKFSANSLCIPVPYAVHKMLYLDISEAAE